MHALLIEALLALLLPIAAASGWIAAKKHYEKKGGGRLQRKLRSTYEQGLNYLVSEDTAKAIELLTTMVDADGDALEIQQALAKLFRKNGEIGKAIDLHERMLQLPGLSESQRHQVHFELAADYMSAGLFDRAELLFRGLVTTSSHSRQATLQLLAIYQAEKDWEKAIQCANLTDGGEWLQRQEILAQLYCEQAESALLQGNLPLSQKLLQQALHEDSRCVRASLLKTQLALHNQNWSEAAVLLRAVEWQNPRFIPETLDLLRLCQLNLGELNEYRAYLGYLGQRHGSEAAGLRLTDEISATEGQNSAMMHLEGLLLQQPSLAVLRKTVQYLNASNLDEVLMPIMQRLNTALDLVVSQQLPYHCSHCGFSARELHWLCPSCRQWGCISQI